MSVTRRDALRRTAVLAAATLLPSLAQGQAPAGYPNRADPLHRSLRARRLPGHGGAHSRAAAGRSARPVGRHRQPARCERRRCSRRAHVGAGRRLSIPRDRRVDVLDQPADLFEAHLRPEEGLRAGRPGGARAVVPGAASEGAGEQLQGVPRLREVAAGQGQLRLVRYRQHASPHGRGDEDVPRARHGARAVQGYGPIGAGTRRRSGRDAVLRLSVARRLRQGWAREAHRDQCCAALVACARPAGDLRARARFRFRPDRRRACTRRNARGHHPEGRHRSRRRNQDAGRDPANGHCRASTRSAPARTTMRKRSRARTRAWRPRSRPPE